MSRAIDEETQKIMQILAEHRGKVVPDPKRALDALDSMAASVEKRAEILKHQIALRDENERLRAALKRIESLAIALGHQSFAEMAREALRGIGL